MLTVWREEARKAKPSHLSLHYDGIRMAMPNDGEVQALCEKHMRAIEDRAQGPAMPVRCCRAPCETTSSIVFRL